MNTNTPRTDARSQNLDSGTINGEYVEADFCRELEAENEWLRKWARNTVAIAADWDSEGATEPKAPLSWESAARMAMDYAKAALHGENASVEAPPRKTPNQEQG